MTVRWGILGTAGIAYRRVAPALALTPGAQVVAVASRDTGKARKFAAERGIPQALGSYDALLASPDVDAIYIPLPNSEHATWALRCAAAGKPVLCEKPLARTAAEAEPVIKAFRDAKLLLAEGFMYRFHPQTERVVSLLREGALGELVGMSAAFTFTLAAGANIRHEAALGGGALLDVGSYCVQALRTFTGEEPIAFRGLARANAQGADEAFAGILEFPSGVLAHFDCGFRGLRANTYEIRGTKGRLTVDKGFTLEPDETPLLRLWRGDTCEELRSPPTNHFVRMFQDFQEALTQGRPVRFPPEDAVANLRVLDRLREAAAGAVDSRVASH